MPGKLSGLSDFLTSVFPSKKMSEWIQLIHLKSQALFTTLSKKHTNQTKEKLSADHLRGKQPPNQTTHCAPAGTSGDLEVPSASPKSSPSVSERGSVARDEMYKQRRAGGRK